MDSTEYQPGAVAVATVRGVAGVRVMRARAGWMLDRGVDGGEPGTYRDYASLADVTDVRPLVVLDLDGYDTIHGPEALRFLADKCDKGKGGNVFARIARDLADQIEAQTRPPRIPEPGLWGVVEANVMGDQSPQADYHWVHLAHDQWEAIGSSQPPRRWAELIDPTLVREGVES